MIPPAGELLVPVGLTLLFILIWWIIYSTPLALSLSLTRNEPGVTGDVSARFGAISIIAGFTWPMMVRTLFFSRPVWSFPISFSRESNKEEEDEEGEHEGSLFSPSDILRLLPCITGYITRVIRHTSIEVIRCHARIGFGDPFSTGIMYGYSQAIIPLLPQKISDIHIIPDFQEPACEGELALTVFISRPVSLLVIAGRLFIPEIVKAGFSRKQNS